ncbi:MAG: HEAT repeat domain-containing protein, partial [Acidobacteria bacterium]|nr:HEAT repeat domain-containing protein [Acidobacteriota bacterium]
TADYLRNFEQNARDPLASAAALALGAFGETSATPVLTDALRNVAAAEAAAAALGELRAAGALDALQQLLASGKSGPAARATAARALGRIGRAESVRPLARGLADPELADACAEALADFGPRAKAALPALQELVARPSQAERSEARLVYSAEASRLMRARIAAVRAIESAAGARAFDLLAPYALDPEIGGTVRHALARLDAVRASELAGSAP